MKLSERVFGRERAQKRYDARNADTGGDDDDGVFFLEVESEFAKGLGKLDRFAHFEKTMQARFG